MNDVEHDLRELFHDRAGSLPVSALAPETVLRRGRRRQVSVVAAGTAMVVVVVAIAAGAIAIVGSGRTSMPAAPSALPPRTATIHGIQVSAPAGWTLIDDWPLASLLPTTSQTCSFSATGIPVGPSPAGAGTSTETTGQPSATCSTETAPLPAGVPVVQLANFSFPLDGSLCHVEQLRSVDLPADGVAVYVAAFDGAMTTADVLDACPGGRSLTTFADRSVRTLYVAVSIVGPDASPGDVSTVDRLMESLGGLRIPDEQPVATSPGYVVAAGDDGTLTWRIEAGFPVRGSSSGIGATLITADENGHETVSDPVAPVEPGQEPSAQTQPLRPEPSALIWGTSSRDVTSIANVTPDGITTQATLIPWPEGLRSTTAESDQSQLDGSIWFAIVAEPGRIEVTSAPSVTGLQRGAVLHAGSDGADASWSLVYQDEQCVRLQVDTSSIGGVGDCLPPWADLESHGGRPLIGGVYGHQLAVIVIVLPADATIDSFRTDGTGPNPDCATIHVESNFAGTQFCIFPLAVGATATITLDANGDPLGSPIGIAAQPGTIELTEGGARTVGAGSPAPSP